MLPTRRWQEIKKQTQLSLYTSLFQCISMMSLYNAFPMLFIDAMRTVSRR